MPMTVKEAFNDFSQLEGIARSEGVATRQLANGLLRILRDHPTDYSVPLLYFVGNRKIEKRNALAMVQTYGESSR